MEARIVDHHHRRRSLTRLWQPYVVIGGKNKVGREPLDCPREQKIVVYGMPDGPWQVPRPCNMYMGPVRASLEGFNFEPGPNKQIMNIGSVRHPRMN